MWQSYIMTFWLAGKNAYLTGFIDDYYRYITELGFTAARPPKMSLRYTVGSLANTGLKRTALVASGYQQPWIGWVCCEPCGWPSGWAK
jgi:hypothetical protein